MEKRKVVFYRTPNGKSPVEDFLDSLPGKKDEIEKAEGSRKDFIRRMAGHERH